jgi:hypothetical protein
MGSILNLVSFVSQRVADPLGWYGCGEASSLEATSRGARLGFGGLPRDLQVILTMVNNTMMGVRILSSISTAKMYLLQKATRLYLTHGEGGTTTASIKMIRSSRIPKHTKFH